MSEENVQEAAAAEAPVEAPAETPATETPVENIESTEAATPTAE